MRASGGTVVPFVRRPETTEGGWLTAPTAQALPTVEERDRVGRQVVNSLFGGGASSVTWYAQSTRLLTAEQLWRVYQRVPDVRAAVDGITRRVATWDWLVEPRPEQADNASAIATAQECTTFLQIPNDNGETWQEVITKVVCDQLVFDVGVIEHVFDTSPSGGPGTHLKELTALRGANIHQVADDYGRLKGYVQDRFVDGGTIVPAPADTDAGQPARPMFEPRQITFLPLTPNTSTPEAVPLIESIVNEVVTIMRSSENTMLSVDADEIPPGILVLTGIAGKAAESAKADIQRLRGKDHKIRIVTNADPQATGAKWVELRRSAKDVDFVNVVKEVRRTIWRVFGVLPVEMGASEDIPRAVGQVQLDVSSSHLIGPLLDLLEAKINARILPLVAGNEARSKLIRFRFNRDARLAPAEEEQRATALGGLVDRGILTRNEARRRLGEQPVEGGNVVMITSGQGVLRLVDAVMPAPAAPAAPAALAIGGPVVPRHAPPGSGCTCTAPHRHRTAQGPPSAGQPDARFDRVRTLDLQDLGAAVRAYTSDVARMWAECEQRVLASVRASWQDGGISEAAADRAQREIEGALSALSSKWNAGSSSLYLRAATIGKDAARDFSGAPTAEDYRAKAEAYHEQAMSYLDGSGGVLPDLRARLLSTLDAVTINGNATQRGRPSVTAPDGLAPDADLDVVLAAMAGAFLANEARIENWSGKLVELANTTLADGLVQAGTAVVDGGVVAEEWMCEWVDVNDRRECKTCSRLGRAGFVPLSTLPTRPGGATECGARCRCVLVLWTRTEVNTGKAMRLGV
jgi:hypothetical protein